MVGMNNLNGRGRGSNTSKESYLPPSNLDMTCQDQSGSES